MRTAGSSREKTWPRIRKKSIHLLHENGFERMNLRALASDTGIQAGSLYNYFKSKHELLAIIVCEIIEELLSKLDGALEGVECPKERLHRFVETMVNWHARKKKEAHISHREIMNLTSADFQRVTKLRKRFEELLEEIIEDGVEQKLFDVRDHKLTAVMILNMLTAISAWYKPSGRLGADILVVEYTEAVDRIVGLR